jgi:hypothetical protein
MARQIEVTPEVVQAIHKAIHSSAKFVAIEGIQFPVKLFKGKWRSIDLGNIKFAEQDRDKSSIYADKAKKGAQITWGMRYADRWIYVEGDTVKMEPFIYATIQ